MKSISQKKIIERSEINYDYKTIMVTKSRLEKGLLAIPKTFSKYFPRLNRKINIYLDDFQKPHVKNFSSFYSSTNENRIGGLRTWFDENQIKEGDELVLQILDKEKFIYRLVKEEEFIGRTRKIQADFDSSKDEGIASEKIKQLSSLTQIRKDEIVFNEFLRLANYSNDELRKRTKTRSESNKEKTPSNIRTLLGNIYKGYCQVCSFTFFKIDNSPYFELHHIEPNSGHHLKNLVLVCANCHRQFEYAKVIKKFDGQGWLSEVVFNQNEHTVKQVIKEIAQKEFYKIVFL